MRAGRLAKRGELGRESRPPALPTPEPELALELALELELELGPRPEFGLELRGVEVSVSTRERKQGDGGTDRPGLASEAPQLVLAASDQHSSSASCSRWPVPGLRRASEARGEWERVRRLRRASKRRRRLARCCECWKSRSGSTREKWSREERRMRGQGKGSGGTSCRRGSPGNVWTTTCDHVSLDDHT